MQVICNTEDFQITEKTAVTLGKFDGIHKGHQLLLNALLEKKKQGLVKHIGFSYHDSAEFLDQVLVDLRFRFC